MEKFNCPICNTSQKDEVYAQLCLTCGWEFEFDIGSDNDLRKVKKAQKLAFKKKYESIETTVREMNALKLERSQLEEKLNELKTELDQLIVEDNKLREELDSENNSPHDSLSFNEIQKILRDLKTSTGLNSRQLELELSDLDLTPQNEIVCEIKGKEVQFKMKTIPMQDVNLILGLSKGQPIIEIQDADLFINVRISKNDFNEEKRDEWVAHKKLEMNLQGQFYPRFSKSSHTGNDFRKTSTKGDSISL